MAGAPKGNKNAVKGNQWRQAIRKALARYADEQGDKAKATRGLELVAARFVEAAAAGEPWAMKELGDRIDGKAAQAVDVTSGGSKIETIDWTILPVTPVDKADETDTEG